MTTALMVLPKKHTGGEWTAYSGYYGTVVSLDAPLDKPLFDHPDYGGALICESVRSEADAMLIAAAPRLLAAVEALLPWVGVLLTESHPIHKRAVTALLLARGGAYGRSSGKRYCHEL